MATVSASRSATLLQLNPSPYGVCASSYQLSSIFVRPQLPGCHDGGGAEGGQHEEGFVESAEALRAGGVGNLTSVR